MTTEQEERQFIVTWRHHRVAVDAANARVATGKAYARILRDDAKRPARPGVVIDIPDDLATIDSFTRASVVREARDPGDGKLRCSTETMFAAATLLGCDWSTRRMQARPGGPDFHKGQICAVHQVIPGKGQYVLARFRYVGDDEWEQAEDA